MGGVQRVVRRSVGSAADAARCHRCLVGTRHPRARDHVGRGGVDAPAADPKGRHATTLLRTVRGHRRLSITARYVQPLPAPRSGDSSMATADFKRGLIVTKSRAPSSVTPKRTIRSIQTWSGPDGTAPVVERSDE